MKTHRLSKIFSICVLSLLVTLFAPQLHFTDSGPELAFTEAFAEGAEPAPDPKPDPKPEPKPQPQPAKKDEEEEEPEPEPQPKSKVEPDPEADPQPKDEPDTVSREEYNSLRKDLEDVKKGRRDETVQRRIDKAIDEKYIDKDDKDGLASVREIAKNDDAWSSYLKVASPKIPEHITAQRFQSKNLKSAKHTGDSGILNTVLEHQK